MIGSHEGLRPQDASFRARPSYGEVLGMLHGKFPDAPSRDIVANVSRLNREEREDRIIAMTEFSETAAELNQTE